MAGAADDFEQLLQIFARGFLARKGAEKEGELGHELVVLEHVIRNASGIDGGEVEKFEPILRALLETELFGPGANGVLVARRGQHFAFDFAPVAWVVPVLQTEFAEAEPLPCPQFFDEGSKHSVLLVRGNHNTTPS